MPRQTDPVQIWGAIRVKDRENRYVFGLRGGPESQISLARYASDGNSKFLGFAPLNFKPAPGEWYRFRVAVAGKRFQVFVNDDKLPRINVEDVKGALWNNGGIALGGGWLPAEFADVKIAPLTGDRLAAFKAIGDGIWEGPAVDKRALRIKQRAAYEPAKLAGLPAVRGETSLDGNWLFMPDQDLTSAKAPSALEVSDTDWHVIPVPSLWTPTLGWLHGEKGMPDLTGLSAYKGPSDQLIVEEFDRVNAQTFDWKNTRAGWYRHYVDLPSEVAGKQFTLVFDAIAKTSEVWVNGIKVGANVGMFREVDCDIGGAVKPGRNVIAVHVIGNSERKAPGPRKVEAVAVSVEVTAEMLQSIPHGMMDNESRGIWQPVKLVITNPVRVGEVFIQPRLDGATANIEILNSDSREHTVDLAYAIRDARDGAVLTMGTEPRTVTVPAGGKTSTKIETAKLQPKLWSPREPNLYSLSLHLAEHGKALDDQATRFGFRTFICDGGKFLLNGKPYWLRGGNHTPATLRPNDGALARRFMRMAREGNVWVTRSHALPFTKTWFEAADEVGFGVSMEGTWPWLMIKGEPPKPELIRLWKEEFSQLMRQHRNHPSLLFWTVNNEMNFAHFDEADVPLLKRKWAVLDDMIRTMRKIDPTRPVSAYSGYTRKGARKGFEAVVKPGHLDDGDIDDAHVYYNWYNESSFHLFDGGFGKNFTPGRPLISQEISTGYPRNDDWPSRSYEFARYVPQALVGNYAFEQSDPAIFMTRQAFMTKEVLEIIRRSNRNETAGLLPFAYLTWFTDVWKTQSIRPKLTYYEVKKAMQGVLVSAELFGRHFYAGDTIERRVCIVNDADDGNPVPAGSLKWELRDGATLLASGQTGAPTVGYYANHWIDAHIQIPGVLPRGRVDAKLVVLLEAGGHTVSTNDYDVTLASRDWATPQPGEKIALFDPAGKSKETMAGIDTLPVSSLDGLSPGNPLVIGDLGALMKSGNNAARLKAFAEAGGRVLLLQPGAQLVALVPQLVKSYRPVQGEIVTMRVPESPVFSGLQPLDTAWFEMGQRNLPCACGGVYQVNWARPEIAPLALQCNIHVDMKAREYSNIAGYPILEIRLGNGVLIASEMMLSAKDKDPIAGRLLTNMLGCLRAAGN